MNRNDLFNVKEKDLTKTEIAVHNYMIANIDQIETMTISSISKEVHVNPSTITRYCNKINCTGFKEFKYYMTSKLVRKTSSNKVDDFQVLADQLSAEKLKQFKKYLENCENIIFLAAGPSYDMVNSVYNRLLKLNYNKRIYISSNNDGSIEWIKSHRKTLIIAISIKGTTPEIFQPAKTGKVCGNHLVAITANSNCELAQIADLFFLGSVSDVLSKKYQSDLNSRYQLLFLLESLFEYGLS